MGRLSKVVNIVPVIAKADTLTLEERDYFKQAVRGVLFVYVHWVFGWQRCFYKCYEIISHELVLDFSSHHTCKSL